MKKLIIGKRFKATCEEGFHLTIFYSLSDAHKWSSLKFTFYCAAVLHCHFISLFYFLISMKNPSNFFYVVVHFWLSFSHPLNLLWASTEHVTICRFKNEKKTLNSSPSIIPSPSIQYLLNIHNSYLDFVFLISWELFMMDEIGDMKEWGRRWDENRYRVDSNALSKWWELWAVQIMGNSIKENSMHLPDAEKWNFFKSEIQQTEIQLRVIQK